MRSDCLRRVGIAPTSWKSLEILELVFRGLALLVPKVSMTCTKTPFLGVTG